MSNVWKDASFFSTSPPHIVIIKYDIWAALALRSNLKETEQYRHVEEGALFTKLLQRGTRDAMAGWVHEGSKKWGLGIIPLRGIDNA